MLSILLSGIAIFFIQKKIKANPEKKYSFILLDFVVAFCVSIFIILMTDALIKLNEMGYYPVILFTLDFGFFSQIIIYIIFFVHILHILFDVNPEKKIETPSESNPDITPSIPDKNKKPRVLTLFAGAGLSITMGVISFIILFFTSLFLYPPRCE